MTRRPTSRSPRRSRRRATTRCPRTTSSGRSTAGPAAAGADEAIERVVYEGYGPAGVAILVEALTDNRNRTSAEIRHAFDKHGGSLGEPGSVAWVFEKRGVVLVDASRYSEDDLIAAIDAGAEDVSKDGDSLKVVCAAEDFAAVREALESAGVEIESAELTMEPKSVVEVTARRRREPHAADGRARRARRRRGGARELRHPGGAARAGRGLRPGAPGRHPGPRARISTRDGRHGHRPGRGEHGLRRRARGGRQDERRRRRGDRGPARRAHRGPHGPDPRGLAELLAGTSRPPWPSRTSTSARTCAPRSRSARLGASSCWPPRRPASRASTTRPRP